LSDLLGREERLEHPIANVCRDSDSGVGHRDHHIGAGPDLLRMDRGKRRIEHHVTGLQDELAATRHGIAGVDRQVDQRGAEL